MNTVHMVVPAGLDDPRHPSGGNVYDRRVCQGLGAGGWTVHEHEVAGPWPSGDDASRTRLAGVIAALPDDGLVLIDGLIASAAPGVVAPEAQRLRIVTLLHLPRGVVEPAARAAERIALAASVAVVTPSRWARQWVLDHYNLPSVQVHVAEPGVEVTSSTSGTPGADRLLSVGAVAPHKCHDLLVSALAELGDMSWSCQIVGALDTAPDFVAQVRGQAQQLGIDQRLSLRGPLTGDALDAAYVSSDVVVVSSRAETYGMVVTEAVAHGVPVIATSVGGVPEALGHDADGRRPGLLVPPGDASALAAAIRSFVRDSSLRSRLRRSVADRRRSLPSWSHTTARVADALASALRSPRFEPTDARFRISTKM